jgi:hypothetical protein
MISTVNFTVVSFLSIEFPVVHLTGAEVFMDRPGAKPGPFIYGGPVHSACMNVLQLVFNLQRSHSHENGERYIGKVCQRVCLICQRAMAKLLGSSVSS